MEGPPVDDLYGRDAGFVEEAMKRQPSPWKKVETTFVSGLACTPERIKNELERIAKAVRPDDLVFIHASTHGTTEHKLLRLEGSGGSPIIDANEICKTLADLPCPALVTIDACMTGGALHSPLPPRSAWLLGCTETQSTSGQMDDLKVPHGFVVLAMCEALRGDADADSDGLVTVGELCGWVPQRASHLARFWCIQDGIVVLPPELANLPLTRSRPGKHKPLWSMKEVKSRNPWGLPDPPPLTRDAAAADKLIAALKNRPFEAKAWENSAGLAKPPLPGKEDVLDGMWESHWTGDSEEKSEKRGRAEIAEKEKGFFAVILDERGTYLIEAERDLKDPTRLSGRWAQLEASEQPVLWEGRIVNDRRIEGQSPKGSWNFRR